MSEDEDPPVAIVLRFPTRRRRAYPSAWLDRRNPPANVRLLHRLVGDIPLPPPTPLPPSGYVLLALIEALARRPPARNWSDDCGVLAELKGMLRRWAGDAEVRRQVRLAIDMICAGETGRWHAD